MAAEEKHRSFIIVLEKVLINVRIFLKKKETIFAFLFNF